MTGLILSRAKAGMTMPAAPRITRASLKTGFSKGVCMDQFMADKGQHVSHKSF